MEHGEISGALVEARDLAEYLRAEIKVERMSRCHAQLRIDELEIEATVPVPVPVPATSAAVGCGDYGNSDGELDDDDDDDDCEQDFVWWAPRVNVSAGARIAGHALAASIGVEHGSDTPWRAVLIPVGEASSKGGAAQQDPLVDAIVNDLKARVKYRMDQRIVARS